MPTPDPRDLADLEALANIGEIVGPVTHEFNNVLNTMLLQIAVLEQTAPDGMRKELTALKQQGKTAAALVRSVQQYRRHQTEGQVRGDLGRAAADAVATARGAPLPEGVTVDWASDDAVPPVRGGTADLRRLATFLVGNATRTGGGAVAVRTERRPTGAALVVEVAGPSVDPAFLTRLTTPNLSGQDGTAGLELAACRSIVRRLGGELRAEPRADGGARVVVEFPAG